MADGIELHLGAVLYVAHNPWDKGVKDPWCFIPQGGIAVEKSKIVACASAEELKKSFPKARINDHGASFILPGLIDLHIHFPQTDIIGSPSSGLLCWLKKHTFPFESRFSDQSVAESTAEAFCEELIAYGTTTAAMFSSSHLTAADALARAVDKAGLRAVLGKCNMDRLAPENLLADVDTELAQTQELIAKWHNPQGRIQYAITPRFAISCTGTLMDRLGELAAKDPSLYVQTHHAETLQEIEMVQDLFPEAEHYLDVYASRGLVRERTLLAHCIHAKDEEFEFIKKHGAGIAHCPTSNLFLGSGFFPMTKAQSAGIRVGLGTDVGGGTSFSMWQTMNEAYKSSMHLQAPLSPAQLFYAATKGGAEALHRSDLGSLAPQSCADFIILDPSRSRLLKRRDLLKQEPDQIIFALVHLTDDRLVTDVFVGGKAIKSKMDLT